MAKRLVVCCDGTWNSLKQAAPTNVVHVYQALAGDATQVGYYHDGVGTRPWERITGGSLGIPLSGGRLINLINRRWQFHDTQLSSTVRSAFHALAIDERASRSNRPSGTRRPPRTASSASRCGSPGSTPTSAAATPTARS